MTMMSCFDEAMQNIEQLASRQRTELLSLIELHNQQLNDFIRAAKENLLRIRSEGQHILASKPEIKEKEKKPISVYPISTTIITTSTSTTTQNAPANKKSTVSDSVVKEKKRRGSSTTTEVKISTNKRENAILQTNLFVSKLPPMKLSKPIVYFTMTPAQPVSNEVKAAPKPRVSKKADVEKVSSTTLTGKRRITTSPPTTTTEIGSSTISSASNASSAEASQVANKRAKASELRAEVNTNLSVDYLATLLSWPKRMAGIRRFISEIEDVDRRRLLQSGCREVFLSWMRDLADQSDSDCEEMWSMETSNSSDSAVGKAHSLGANLFIETLLVTVDQAPWSDEDVATSRVDKIVKKVYKKLDELADYSTGRETVDIKHHPNYHFSGRIDSSNFDILYAMWRKFRNRYKASSGSNNERT